MNPQSEQEKARRLFKKADFCASIAIPLLHALVVIGLLRAIDICTGWSLTHDAGGITCMLWVWIPKSNKRAAAWWVRRAGLSQESHLSETFADAGARASRALSQAAPIEKHPMPRTTSRLRFYRVMAAIMAGVVVIVLGLSLWPDESGTSIPSKVLLLFLGLTSALMCALYLCLLALDPADLRIDAHGVSGPRFQRRRRSARWDQVSSLQVTRFYNVVGDLEEVVFYFFGAGSEVLCALSPPSAGEALLRQVCAEHQGGSST